MWAVIHRFNDGGILMYKNVVVISMCVSFLICVACTRNETIQTTENKISSEEAAKTVHEKLKTLESDAKRAALLKDFVQAYPENEEIVDALRNLVRYQGLLGGDMAGALMFIENTRSNVEDAKLGKRIDLLLCENYGKAHDLDGFSKTADRLACGKLSFGENLSVIKVATTLSSWDQLDRFITTTEPLANAATFRSDYPDDDFTDARVEAAGKSRAATIKIYRAWFKANHGQFDEAMTDFEAANHDTSRDFFGQPIGAPIDYLKGKALLLNGESEAATGLVAKAAISSDNKDAQKLLEEIHQKSGKTEDFPTFEVSEKTKVAQQIAEFSLDGYDGNKHSLDDLGDKATLLAFWHPT